MSTRFHHHRQVRSSQRRHLPRSLRGQGSTRAANRSRSRETGRVAENKLKYGASWQVGLRDATLHNSRLNKCRVGICYQYFIWEKVAARRGVAKTSETPTKQGLMCPTICRMVRVGNQWVMIEVSHGVPRDPSASCLQQRANMPTSSLKSSRDCWRQLFCKRAMPYIPLMDLSTLTPEDNRSWHLNRAALDHACRDWPSASIIIENNLQRLERKQLVAPAYIVRCRELFEQGPEQMREAFLALTDEGQLLRSIHPFAGLLETSERQEVLERTREAFRR